MSAPTNSLNNVRLQETALPSEEYNKLPHIYNMEEAAAKHANAHAMLLGIIAVHGLAGTYSLHLINMHFEVPDGQIMVYEKHLFATHDDFILCSPQDPRECPGARGLHFKAASGGNMVAYEFTTGPGADLSAHEGFVAEFASAVLKLGVQNVFALTALSIYPQDKVLTEFEIGEVRSTVFVDAAWVVVGGNSGECASTDWVATADYAPYAYGSVPNNAQLVKLITESNSRYRFRCRRTRDIQTPMESALNIGKYPVRKGTEQHNIIAHALQLVETPGQLARTESRVVIS